VKPALPDKMVKRMKTPNLSTNVAHNAPDRAISEDGIIRLALNHPPPVPHVFNPIFSAAMTAVLEEVPPATLVSTHRWTGTENDRHRGALFAQRRLGALPAPDRVVVAHSTQAAIHMLLPGIMPPGRPLAVEQMTYPPIRSFAHRYRIPVVDVAIDKHGLDPQAFEDTCRMSSPAAVYLLSTFQNPTTVTMPLDRRRDIAAIARRYHVQIIEDDVYSLLASSPLPPVSALAPELAWYLLGTAKSFSAGLKLAFVVAPSAAEAKRSFWPGVRATYWMASPISAAIMAHLIETGGDLKILAAVREELAVRHHMVTTALQHRPRASDPGCLHVWIPLGSGLSSATASAAILDHGVQVAASDSYAHEGWTPPQAIRIGIGNPSSGDVLARALETIVRSLDALQENTRRLETSGARL